jgi:hypothetical protein
MGALSREHGISVSLSGPVPGLAYGFVLFISEVVAAHRPKADGGGQPVIRPRRIRPMG